MCTIAVLMILVVKNSVLVDFFPFHYIQTGSGGHTTSYTMGTGSLAVKQPGHELTAHLHIMLSLRMCGVIPQLPNTSSWHGA